MKKSLVTLALGLFAFAALNAQAGAALVPDGYNPKGLPTAGCFWTGPFTASRDLTNIAYPGTEIAYWGAKFRTPAGAVLKLHGKYPHARYSSLNAYESSGGTPTGSISDRQIRPDRGSVNTSLPGKNRKAKKRSWTVRVLGTAAPQNPGRNTLYAESADDEYQDILYRVYVPDKGRNYAGGTGIPTPELVLQDGTVLKGKALCQAINSNHNYVSNPLPLPLYNSLVNWPGKDPLTNPAPANFSFVKFFNLNLSMARYKTDAEFDATWQANPVEQGTLYANNDARYMTGAVSLRYGKVLVIKGSMPTTPKTWHGNRRTKAGQLAEWDMCSIESLATTKTHRCLFDQQIPVKGKKRRYTIVASLAGDRPKNATRKCGVAWLAFDPDGDGAGRKDSQLLLTRNVIPSRGFKHAVQNVTTPYNAAKIMGRYYPRGSYTSKSAFQKLGCPKAGL
ncbi:MAG: hypothetical protein KDB54_01300 [Solirubrobacterales bacterium]|nr:hypothetical protein [Solirubrobacterales bacterium]MCB0859273.1 hypothetical protein [Solirubrobacterales bacterium]